MIRLQTSGVADWAARFLQTEQFTLTTRKLLKRLLRRHKMNKLTLGEICAAVGGKTAADENIIIRSITTDSRKIEEGCLFIALSGERFDGHDFIPSAFEKGAVCCLSEKDGFEGSVIFVEDTKKALRDLAEYYLSTLDIKVVGITGSVGKTTTKDMIASVLAQKYNVLKTDGNFNNEIGLPLTVFRLDSAHEAAVLEMGMNSFGEMYLLEDVMICSPFR